MRCVALFSGGLDSRLAIHLMQDQGIEVEAINFQTAFTCCQDRAAHVAQELGVRLTVLAQHDDYLNTIRNPRFGYGRGANPCVDCRIYMFERARKFMQQVSAQFVVSGEVVGQRLMSQKRRDLDTIAHHADLYDLLLRPLSAKILPPTLPERVGWVDREKLHGFFGRGRSGLIRLAKSLGIEEIPTPSTGCALSEKNFAFKVFDLLKRQPASGAWDFELLKYGRHFRFSDECKVVVGRREAENAQLEYMYQSAILDRIALLTPADFQGPMALLVGPVTDEALEFACALMLRFSKPLDGRRNHVRVQVGLTERLLEAHPHPSAQNAKNLATQ